MTIPKPQIEQSRAGSALKLRDSNIELLRILSMVMIVFHHFAVHGQETLLPTACNSLSQLWLVFITMGGKVGVNIFILISGYYLILDKGTFFSIRKLAKLLGEMMFYAITLFIFFSFFVEEERFCLTNLRSVFQGFLPLHWWFATDYLILFLVHPVLNIALHRLSINQYQKLLVLSFFIFSLIPTILRRTLLENEMWFIYLYTVGGYFQLHGQHLRLRKRFLLTGGIVCYLLAFVFEAAGIRFLHRDIHFWNKENMFVLLASLSIFLGFLRMKIPGNRWINMIAAAAFGVYLIHDYPYNSGFLWKRWLETPSFANLNLIIPYSITVVLVIYIVCTGIDLLRIYLFEKPFMKWVNRHSENWDNKLRKVYGWLSKVFFKAENN